MKSTILSRKELNILERIISNCGNIASFDEIKKLFSKDYSLQELRKQISLLSKRGWLIRIKRGTFAVASLESHNFSNISPLVISQVLVPNSYVSFEYALSQYGLFDQLPNRITSVTSVKPKRFTFQDTNYQFLKAKPELYFGYREISVAGQRANVAEREKVVLDYLYFRNDAYSIDLLLEKLGEGKDVFDFDKLMEYGLRYSLSVKRRLGFLLDLIDVDSDQLHRETSKKTGYSKLTKNSNEFNAKWRIYYEDRFIKQSPAVHYQ